MGKVRRNDDASAMNLFFTVSRKVRLGTEFSSESTESELCEDKIFAKELGEIAKGQIMETICLLIKTFRSSNDKPDSLD